VSACARASDGAPAEERRDTAGVAGERRIVERYLAALTGHDWDALRECLHPEVVRVGPFDDEYEGRDAYVGFLAALMPKLPEYSMEVHRVTYAGPLAFAELAENVGGVRTEEAIVFALDGASITRIDVFIKTRPP
jgi:ketosteroid isomerase-like protein